MNYWDAYRLPDSLAGEIYDAIMRTVPYALRVALNDADKRVVAETKTNIAGYGIVQSAGLRNIGDPTYIVPLWDANSVTVKQSVPVERDKVTSMKGAAVSIEFDKE